MTISTAHATSTIASDKSELEAIKTVFKDNVPLIITGHSIGASGVHELIYSILMLNNNFLFGNHDYETDKEFVQIPILKINQYYFV